ncbi:MAG: hypothetical protein HDT29_06030 [Clostridiales bacterium]|nr:hypothetical protein [Clostridiales bacterium]
MLKKRISIFLIAVMILVAVFATAGCQKDDGGLFSVDKDAVDPYGRDFNCAYNVDEYDSGLYAVSFEIEASAMGKSMLVKNCADKVLVKKSKDGYTLTYYCYNDSFTNIRLYGVEAISADKDGAYGYSFDVAREDLDLQLEMSGYVKVMSRDVEFKIELNLDDAILIG